MMYVFAVLAVFFLGMQCIDALVNFLFSVRLKKGFFSSSDRVSVLIPARNEEKKIGLLLEQLILNKNIYEILIYNDESTDQTSRVVQDFQKKDSRITLIQGFSLPKGWLGKNHACDALSKRAQGNYLLFLDADVILYDDLIEDVLFYLKTKRLGLVSLFPVQILKSFGEKASVPIMNYILLTLLPLFLVRLSPFSSHAAANGQFMFFDASIYHKIKPHEHFKSAAVEDIAIARYFKKQKIKISFLSGDSRCQCRMYTSYREALNGFSKNIYHLFGNIKVFAFGFWLFSSLGFIPVLFIWPDYFFLYVLGVFFTIIFYSLAARQNVFLSLILWPLHLIFILHVLLYSLILKKRKSVLWKERLIYS